MIIALTMIAKRNCMNMMWLIPLALYEWDGWITIFTLMALLVIYKFASTGAFKANLIYYLITNFGEWMLGYPHNISGMMTCYALALPFFVSAYCMTLLTLMIAYVCIPKYLRLHDYVAIKSYM